MTGFEIEQDYLIGDRAKGSHGESDRWYRLEDQLDVEDSVR